jgi:arylsulfatase A-like enzyme
MQSQPGIEAVELAESVVPQTAEPAQRIPLGPAMVLLVGTWIGLLAGFLDLGLMILKRRLISEDFYRLGEHFVWIIPLGVAALVLMPGLVLALLAWLRRGVGAGLAVACLSFVAFLDLCARLPFELWAALLLSAGLATQSARVASRRRGAFLKLVRRTTPLLLGIVMVLLLATVGGRAWSEHRAAMSLPPPPRAARNLLLIVWDTVRASNLSLYGYSRPTTPNLELLARRGMRFDLAFATSSWTLPSHASLFTGQWPYELGVDWKSPLGDGAPTLAGYLAARGYDTAGFVANLDYCGRESGLARGFAHYDDFPINLAEVFTRYIGLGLRLEIPVWTCFLDKLLEKYSGRSSDLVPRTLEHAKRGAEVDGAFLDWLSWQQGRRRPFFAFLNYNDAHTPYGVPGRSAGGFGLRPASFRDHLTLLSWNSMDRASLSDHDVRMAGDVYDDGIAYLDRRLGILLDELGRRGVLDETVVIVASDHGEHLGDHLLFFHGCSLYRQLVQVPLVIVDSQRVPAGRVVSEPVSLRDVPATVVDLLGLGRETPFPGRSLERFWAPDRSATEPLSEPLLMETGKPLLLTNQGREPAAKGPMRSLIAGGRSYIRSADGSEELWHYIRSADGSEEVYSLSSDPEERINLAGSRIAVTDIQRFRSILSGMRRKR